MNLLLGLDDLGEQRRDDDAPVVVVAGLSSQDLSPLLHKRSTSTWNPTLSLAVLPANRPFLGVGDAGFEPATSAVWRQWDSLLQVSRDCKVPANSRICVLSLFPTFPEIYPGCCTVAAQIQGLARQESFIFPGSAHEAAGLRSGECAGPRGKEHVARSHGRPPEFVTSSTATLRRYEIDLSVYGHQLDPQEIYRRPAQVEPSLEEPVALAKISPAFGRTGPGTAWSRPPTRLPSASNVPERFGWWDLQMHAATYHGRRVRIRRAARTCRRRWPARKRSS